jgi:diguanylate cyclase (GGDEF)-like protein/PAS domain S-box-containing protein
MMDRRLSVLMIEDSPMDAELIAARLTETGFGIDTKRIQSESEMRDCLSDATWDIILCDYSMPTFDPFMALEILHASALDIPLVVISGTVGEENIIRLLKAGCHDCIMKYNLGRISSVVLREIEEARVRKELLSMKGRLERFRILAGRAYEAMLFVDMDGAIVDCNDTAATMYGYSAEQLSAMNLGDFSLPAERDAFQQRIAGAKDDGTVFEAVHVRSGGQTMNVEISLTGASIEGKRLTLGVIRDITERVRREQEILYLSQHDVMTGLFNRAHFEEAMRRMEMEGDRPISVIMGDVDGLKLINDGFGHAEGDRFLIETARILKNSIRNGDVLARIGGDEFCILLPGTSASEVAAVCGSILKEFTDEGRNRTRNGVAPCISIGYATEAKESEPIAQIMKHAEEFMLRRKLLERRSMHNVLLSSIRNMLFEKSHETEEHAQRLIDLSRPLGKALGLNDEQLNELELLSSLHDIGKMHIEDRILLKPGRLSDEEFIEIRKHPETGYRIALGSPELTGIAMGILCHHEKWDGTGYPHGLAGESIPLQSRIIAVVDAFDAMTQDRPYRKALPVPVAVEEIRKNAGTQFEPRIAALFIEQIETLGVNGLFF